MMLITTIVISCVFVIGALAMYTAYYYVELKGYERGLDEAEQIIEEVYCERRENLRNM